MARIIFHIDIDAFYAAVEQIDNPSLKGKPVIVGAKPGGRGVVSTCSYEARKYGVKSAMPISQAYRLCPNGIYLPVRMSRYLQVSKTVMHILKDYSPAFQQVSVDEAFLDMTGTERLFGPPKEVAQKIKKRIHRETGLTISIGIASNRYLAKLASEYGKPDGLFIVEKGSEVDFIDKLELKSLWGLGKKTLERLNELNITTIEQLRAYPLPLLSAVLGDAAGKYLYNAVRGIEVEIHEQETKSRSISSERTFQKDRRDLPGIKRTIMELSHEVMFRLLNDKYRSKTVTLKLRYADFTTVNIQKSLKHWVSSAEEFYGINLELLRKKWNKSRALRLIGVGLANLVPRESAEQQELFADAYDKKRKVEETVTEIRKKIGNTKLTKASLLKYRKKPTQPPG
ncbi:MAG: DNA polymerase IV [Spirochaetales bacterium]|nr:DNA polymerase IV [Spirochaetales bacterium]